MEVQVLLSAPYQEHKNDTMKPASKRGGFCCVQGWDMSWGYVMGDMSWVCHGDGGLTTELNYDTLSPR